MGGDDVPRGRDQDTRCFGGQFGPRERVLAHVAIVCGPMLHTRPPTDTVTSVNVFYGRLSLRVCGTRREGCLRLRAQPHEDQDGFW